MAAMASFSYPEPFLRAVRRGALAKSISELASDWLVLTPDMVFLPCFYGIRLWIWPEPLVAPRERRALGTRMPWLLLTKLVPTSVAGTFQKDPGYEDELVPAWGMSANALQCVSKKVNPFKFKLSIL
jgi:hypothetical protein